MQNKINSFATARKIRSFNGDWIELIYPVFLFILIR